MTESEPDYGNWIRKKAIVIILCISVLFLACGFIPWHMAFRILTFVFCGLSFITALIVAGVYWYFSPNGGNYQRKIFDLVIRKLSWNGEGRCLDIGAGNGFLIIELAKRYPKSTCTGLDYWGKTGNTRDIPANRMPCLKESIAAYLSQTAALQSCLSKTVISIVR